MNAIARHLADLVRIHGRDWFDLETQFCVGSRDTLWYAIALLYSDEEVERALGDRLLGEASCGDGTHTPATMLAILLCIPTRISEATADHLDGLVVKSLPDAAMAEWHDGNVNHPLAAWATLILGGERHGDTLAVQSGAGRLRMLADTVGNRRHATHRQAVYSEYNSPTYSALNLWFLALMAEYTNDQEIRDLALFLEQRLWVETALFYHAPSQQFSGPHSRAYLDDSLGGWSALHCTMAVAFDQPLLLDPQRSLKTNHPSAILENSLVAIIPFHVPDEARHLAFVKTLPCSVRAMTYGESYHENHATHGFEDGLYPGGWSQLTSWQTAEFALGTASRPYVNAGHADAFMARWRRRTEVKSVTDIRSAFCRGVFNDSAVGKPNCVHVTGGATDESYLYEEGRTCTLQHRNKALVQYAPKGVGHRDVSRFRVDVMFSYDAPFDEFWIDGKCAETTAATLPATSRFLWRDGDMLGVLIPLIPQPRATDQPVALSMSGGCFVISIANYLGPPRDFPRDEIRSWANGFYCELWSTQDFADRDALWAHAREIEIKDRPAGGGRHRHTIVRTGDDVLELVQNPWSEEIEQATVNGSSVAISHFEATSAEDGSALIDPLTLYGKEARAVFDAQSKEQS